MKLEENFKLTLSSLHAEDPDFNPTYVRDLNMPALLKRLKNKDIEINKDFSKKLIDYHDNQMEVDYAETLGSGAKILGYKLKSGNLEIEIKNHEDLQNMNPGAMGAPVRGEAGLECTITLQGSYKEGEIVEIAKKVVSEYYWSIRKKVEKDNKPVFCDWEDL